MNNATKLICLVALSVCTCTKLPPSFKKCSRSQPDLSDCLSKAVDDAIKQLEQPFKEVGLPTLEPLEIPALTIGAGTGAVGLVQNFQNVKIYGFTKPAFTKFEMDVEKKTARIECTFPKVKILADYDVNGKILLLPVYGKGPATITMENVNGFETFTFEEFEKKGKKHFKLVEGKLTLTPGGVTFNFENLFDGDKALGDNINKVLNENWLEVFSDVKTSYEDAFGQIIMRLFDNVLSKVSLDDFFDE